MFGATYEASSVQIALAARATPAVRAKEILTRATDLEARGRYHTQFHKTPLRTPIENLEMIKC